MTAWKRMIWQLMEETARYYRITERGRVQLNLYRGEWANYSEKISRIFGGGLYMNREMFMKSWNPSSGYPR